jgi:hypothetical protein
VRKFQVRLAQLFLRQPAVFHICASAKSFHHAVIQVRNRLPAADKTPIAPVAATQHGEEISNSGPRSVESISGLAAVAWLQNLGGTLRRHQSRMNSFPQPNTPICASTLRT